MDELKAKILLNTVTEIGTARANLLMERFGSAAGALSAGREALASAGIPAGAAAKVASAARDPGAADREMDRAEKLGVKITVPGNADYPQQLTDLPDPPMVLYYRGEFSARDAFSVAVVGTRKPTSYGRMAAEKLAGELAGLGVTVVSGLARGVDTFAHEAALAAGGRTVAVVGNGLNAHYPPENRKLEDRIAAGSGCLVSEFPLDAKPDRQNFPRRNRLIAGLSLGTVVVESDIRSGALITAKFAAEQGKDVFAVPGSVFSRYSLGPHMLLRQGAKLVQEAGDVIEEIACLADAVGDRLAEHPGPAQGEFAPADGAESEILGSLEGEPRGLDIDALQSSVSLPFSELSRALLSLELKKMVRALPGKIYVKL